MFRRKNRWIDIQINHVLMPELVWLLHWGVCRRVWGRFDLIACSSESISFRIWSGIAFHAPVQSTLFEIEILFAVLSRRLMPWQMVFQTFSFLTHSGNFKSKNFRWWIHQKGWMTQSADNENVRKISFVIYNFIFHTGILPFEILPKWCIFQATSFGWHISHRLNKSS